MRNPNLVTAPTFEAHLAENLHLSWDHDNKMLCLEHTIEDPLEPKITTRTVILNLRQVYDLISAFGVYHTERQTKED